MLTSLAGIFLLGMLGAYLAGLLRLPGLFGMLLVGVALGPFGWNWLDASVLHISGDLRQLALVIILTRVGLALDLDDLRRVGRPAVLMCFVPAVFEILAIVALAPPLLGVSRLEAAIIGAVVAAVSPAVIVPRMLRLMEAGWGARKRIPQLVMAGASVDDVFVIVVFTVLTGMASGREVAATDWLRIPAAVAAGVALGMAAGWLLMCWFRRVALRDSVKVIVLLSVSCLLLAVERVAPVPCSGLLAVLCAALMLLRCDAGLAGRLSGKFSKLWIAAEILLFVLVGATVDWRYACAAGPLIVAVVAGALVFRMVGVWCCLPGTVLNGRERLFCMLAYIPKATVQAAIGGIPLSMGLACGRLVLTVAVISILLTAPLGAWLIDWSYRRLLTKPE